MLFIEPTYPETPKRFVFQSLTKKNNPRPALTGRFGAECHTAVAAAEQ